jgi:hypothetical protein
MRPNPDHATEIEAIPRLSQQRLDGVKGRTSGCQVGVCPARVAARALSLVVVDQDDAVSPPRAVLLVVEQEASERTAQGRTTVLPRWLDASRYGASSRYRRRAAGGPGSLGVAAPTNVAALWGWPTNAYRPEAAGTCVRTSAALIRPASRSAMTASMPGDGVVTAAVWSRRPAVLAQARHQEGITSVGMARHLAAPLGTLTSQNGPCRYGTSDGNRVHTEEVTGSIPVSPTSRRNPLTSMVRGFLRLLGMPK